MKFPKYIKDKTGDIGVFSHITWGDRPVYKFDNGEFKFRMATHEEIAGGSDRLSDLQGQPRTSMVWKQISSTKWEAAGKHGTFLIERSGRRFWSYYTSDTRYYKLQSTDKLAKAKDKCERSPDWEDAV